MDTVAVTGGNGKIGSAIIAELNDRGYRSVDLARGKRREEISDEYRTTNLLEAGEVYGSLARSDAEAIIHMGTIPSPTSHPGYVTYESNVMSTYHVLEAASELGLEAACLASSINAMGYDFQDALTEVDYLPVDEDHRLTPRDPYAVSKHCIETTADGFGRQERSPQTIGSLRYPWVATGEELRDAYADTERTLADFEDGWAESGNDLFTYLHLEDAAAIAVDVVEAGFEGHEVFWAVANDTITDVPTPELLDAFYPDVEVRGELTGHDALISVGKARRLLGWEPERSWRER